MKDNAPNEDVIERLDVALKEGLFPKAARGHAQHLLNRLSSPVRVTVLGNPSVGKTQLLNLLLGQRALPKESALPTTEVVYGDIEEIEVTTSKGEKVLIPGLDFEAVKAHAPVLLQVRLPRPILKKISLLEVVTSGDQEELKSAVDWAIRRTDITLWCSHAFGDSERELWARVPDALKDHAFLVLTKADVLSAQNALSSLIASLETVVAEEFHSLFAVATLQGIKAQTDFPKLDETMYHGSGASALASEILRHAERGRRADLDSAQLFLARYQSRMELDHGPRTEASERRSVAPLLEPLSSLKTAHSNPQPSPAQPTREQSLKTVAPMDPELFISASRFLARRGDSFFKEIEKTGNPNVRDQIGQFVESVEHLIDIFSSDESECPVVDAFIDDLNEASEMMVLMQVEADMGPLADAATVLLQLRREIEVKLAA